MFNKKYEDRLRAWVDFRDSLVNSPDPIKDVIGLYSKAPAVNIQVDPWDPSSWLSPWELLRENSYCEFSKILGICYTLQLTDSFLTSAFKIHIITVDSTVKYLLFVDDKVIGYDPAHAVNVSELPVTMRTEIVYDMQSLR